MGLAEHQQHILDGSRDVFLSNLQLPIVRRHSEREQLTAADRLHKIQTQNA